jgi:hypothetical protein
MDKVIYACAVAETRLCMLTTEAGLASHSASHDLL